MVSSAALVAIAAVSLLGAGGAAVVTLRHYEPPPPEDGSEPPEPVLEAAIFFVAMAAVFGVIGFGIATVWSSFGSIGRLATFALTPLGLISAWATYTERLGSEADPAPRLMGTITGSVLAAYPVVLDVASLL